MRSPAAVAPYTLRLNTFVRAPDIHEGKHHDCLRVGTVDDRLGSSSGRFFGEGYKGVVRRLTDVKIIDGDQGRGEIHGTASLSYESKWSTKGGRTQLRPHLSTPDGLLLAVNLVEAYLVHVYDLTAQERRRMWVSELSFQAGSRPQEDLRMRRRSVEFTIRQTRLCPKGAS